MKLEIHNDGPPIPRDLLPRIFEPMVQGQHDTGEKRRRIGSMGLGLYIAREVAGAHEGTIDVNSAAEAGTTFTVRLPRHPPSRS